MAYEQREGQGSLFKNGRKEEGSKQPDYQGSVMIGGVAYELAGWLKTSATGIKFMSLAAKPKQEREPAQRVERKPKDSGSIAEMPDEVPF